MRKSFCTILGFKIVLFLTIAIAGFGQAVLHLWNWLMPTLFGLHPISFWQAVGLLALSWILFGGWRGLGGRPGPGGHMRRRLLERWEKMTPEERDRFRAGLSHGCGRSQGQASQQP
ncbi:MAG: hypothetical protein U0V70_22120 [Terriglobia bacterium]